MRYAFCILLALLLCLGAGLIFVMLAEPSGTVQTMGNPPEAVSVRSLPASPASGSSPEEEPVSPAESSPSSKEEQPLPAEESLLPAESEAPPAPTEDRSTSAEDPSPSEPEPPAPAEDPAVPEVSPPPKTEPIPPQEPEEWMLRLVNWENPLPAGFEPEYEAVQNRFVMDKRVAPIARQMIADAQAQGITLVVNSAYRPYSAQQTVYENRFQKYLDEGRTEQEARWLTNSYVAIPGYSEHQLGLAMDIVAVANGERVDSWLVDHAPEYGFILRYPEDKTSITHTAYESWHYRFVGVPTAREITDRGLCLEEYLAGRTEAAG